MRDSGEEFAVGCASWLLVVILGAPLTLLSTWLTAVMWDWPVLGIGWWSDHPIPDWELRWVVAATALTVLSRIPSK
jgi:hypothetical protein